jgi:hypothetical protein
VYLYYGGPAGLSSTADMTWTGTTARQRLGSGVAFLGDVNGDGLEDVALGSPGFSGGRSKQGAVHVYLGTAAGPSATAAFQLLGDRADRQLGGTLSRVGDVNGDGLDDVLAGIYADRAGPTGAVTWFPGGSAMSTASGVVISRPSQFFGGLVAGVGDLNGDGYADFIAGDPGERAFNAAYLHQGGAGGPLASPARSWPSSGVGGAASGDFNGDGWPDLALSTAIGVTTYGGGPGGIAPVPTGEVESLAWSWVRPLAAGDMNGDGFDDVLLGNALDGSYGEGSLRVVLGSAAGLVDDGERLLLGGGADFHLGASVAMGDANGDGLDDLLAGAPSTVPPDTGLPARPTVQTWRRGNAFFFDGGSDPLGVAGPMVTFTSGDPDAAFAFGDVNADGIPDLVWDDGVNPEAYFGSPTGFPATASQVAPPTGSTATGQDGVAACDVDGDGQAEVFQQSNWFTGDVVYAYDTGLTGMLAPTTLTLQGSPGVGAARVRCAGDTDGDGDEELMVFISASSFWWIDLYPGSPSGVSAATRVRLGAPTCFTCAAHFVTDAVGGADVTGDGIDDIVGAIEGNRLVLWRGRPGGPSITPDQILTIPSTLPTLGYRIASGGDLNGDGFDDVLIADQATQPNGRRGTVFALPGGPTGVGTPPLARLVSLTDQSTLEGGAMTIVPDLTGDGYDDVVLGAQYRSTATVVTDPLLWVYAGGPAGVSAAPVYTTPGALPVTTALAAGDLDADGYGEVGLFVEQPQGTTAAVGLYLLKFDGFGLSVIP